MRNALFISMTLLAGSMPVSADQAAVNPQSPARFGALRAAQSSNPYSKLFEARGALKQAVQQELTKAGSPKTRIVCGMTIIEADPSIDPKMAVAPPKDEKLRHTIRAIEPPMCWSRD